MRTTIVTAVAFASFLGADAATGQQPGAATVAVIGTGEVASALGPRLAEAGYRVVYGSREPERSDVAELVARSGPRAGAATPAEAARVAEIILLAVPWDAVEEVAAGLGDVAGKVIIDPSNPRTIADDGFRDYAFHEGSNAELIQAVVPGAHVVKAFNTLGAGSMADPASTGGPVSIPLVGDDPDAKRRVAALVEALGLEPVDVGPLRHARIVEGLYYLRLNTGLTRGALFNYYFRTQPD